MGKTERGWDCVLSDGWLGRVLNVLVFESVGVGVTGPMERRDAAKCGSCASRSMTVI